MSAEVFRQSNCPLCGGTARSATGHFNGRLVCPCCNSSLVVSDHGQFVRDPFIREPLISIQQLRRQSQPLARILRDVRSPLRVMLSGLTLLLIGGIAWSTLVCQPTDWQNQSPSTIEQSK